jgi:hypothetical protein
MRIVFLKANVPFHKVKNTIIRNTSQHYAKKYLTDCYKEIIKNIRNNVISKKIFVSINETTYCEDRYVVNVIIGIFDKNSPGKLFLLIFEKLDKANYSTIYNHLINQCFFYGFLFKNSRKRNS